MSRVEPCDPGFWDEDGPAGLPASVQAAWDALPPGLYDCDLATGLPSPVEP